MKHIAYHNIVKLIDNAYYKSTINNSKLSKFTHCGITRFLFKLYYY